MIKKQFKFTILIIVLIFCKINVSNAQSDTISYQIFDFTIEPGVFFPNSQNFQYSYNSKSAFNFSFGAKFGKTDWKVLPWIKFSRYQSKIDSLITTEVADFAIAKRNQISVGIVNPVKLRNNDYLQFKCGLSYNLISEEMTELVSKTPGFIMSVGYMKRFTKFFTYYVDLNYDYAMSESGYYFKDWSGFLINCGLSVNIAAE
jgi:hypothetical protein